MTRPTYEIIGRIGRFGERDSVLSREWLTPGSPDEVRYHAMRPELREIGSRITAFIDDKFDRARAAWGRAYCQAGFSSLAHLGLPDCVDGEPSPEPVVMDPAAAARQGPYPKVAGSRSGASASGRWTLRAACSTGQRRAPRV
jgi:hypothetical protein